MYRHYRKYRNCGHPVLSAILLMYLCVIQQEMKMLRQIRSYLMSLVIIHNRNGSASPLAPVLTKTSRTSDFSLLVLLILLFVLPN